MKQYITLSHKEKPFHLAWKIQLNYLGEEEWAFTGVFLLFIKNQS